MQINLHFFFIIVEIFILMRHDLIKRILTEGLNLSYAKPKNIYWEGDDKDIAESLFEYGFVVRQPENKDTLDEWFVLFKVGENQFDSGWVCESDLDDLMMGKDWMDAGSIESVLESTGEVLDEWLKGSFRYKLSTLLGYYGYENIIGSSYSPISKNEAIVMLNQYLPPNTSEIPKEDELVCPGCGSDDISGDYNYDTGRTDYTCQDCDQNFNV